MIKASGVDAQGRKTLMLGLSFANLKSLQAGDSITFAGEPYGYPGDLMLFAGRDERTMAEMLIRENPGLRPTYEKDAP